jgi:ribosomal protein S17E
MVCKLRYSTQKSVLSATFISNKSLVENVAENFSDSFQEKQFQLNKVSVDFH